MSRRYPHYRDSGVAWLGEVPRHWEVIRISATARPGARSFTDGDWVEFPYITDSGVRLIQTGNIGVGTYREQGFRYIDESSFDELRCTDIDPRDILICRLADPVGRACLAPNLGGRMITSVDVCILKPSERFSSDYLVFLFSSKRYLGYVESLVRGGTRDRISRSMLGSIKIPNPPAIEQRGIAEFLTGETERIDALVVRKGQLIEHLNEYRTALIARTVTRGLPPEAAGTAGLDPSPRLKPSSVERLGELPEHWEVKRLRFVASINDATLSGSEDPVRPITYVDISSVDPVGGIVQAEEMVFEDAPSRARRLVRDGDTLVSTVRTYLRAITPVCAPPPEMVVSTGFAVVRPRTLDPGYMSWVLREHGIVEEIVARSTGVSYPAINPSAIGDLDIPMPPLEEQVAIAKFLDRKTKQIDALSSRVAVALERLGEFRLSLITAAVTGRIDLRESIVAEVEADSR